MARWLFSLVLLAAVIFPCFGIGTKASFDLKKEEDGDEATVVATYHLYMPENIQWNLNAANAFCTTWDVKQPFEWRRRYGWTSFCGPVGPTGRASCGRCLHITNVETGDETTARIVDQCTNGGLDLDYHVFRRLDSDGNGYARGHLKVTYKFIDSC